MEIDLERFRETFFQEAGEHVGQMEAGLLALAAGDVNLELLNAVFRGAHSVKGAAGTFGLLDITEFAHAMESLLDGMRSGQVQAEKSRIDLLLEAVDVLAAMLQAARRNTAGPANLAEVRRRLIRARRPVPSAPEAPRKLRRLDAEIFLQAMNPALVLRELGRLSGAAN